jgi:hypothetical protein
LLVYLAVATAGVTLAKSVLDLITTGDTFREEVAFRIGHSNAVDPKAIEKQVAEAIDKLLKKSDTPDN